MKLYTETELLHVVKVVMKSSDWKINLVKSTKTELLFEATHMYNWDTYTPSFPQLLAFSQEFGTDKIDKYDDISISGCETCDYGSKYGFALRVWE